MEFKEFVNPESRDYDVNNSLYRSIYEDISNNISENPYHLQLINLIGILEDITEEELQQNYGISMKEYLNPTATTIDKVSNAISCKRNTRHR